MKEEKKKKRQELRNGTRKGDTGTEFLPTTSQLHEIHVTFYIF